jgi:hypothetical protein
MFSDLSSSIYLLSGAALVTLLTFIRRPKIHWAKIQWPKIRLQTQSQNHGSIHVTDIKLSVCGQGRSRTGLRGRIPKFELAVYVVFKKS